MTRTSCGVTPSSTASASSVCSRFCTMGGIDASREATRFFWRSSFQLRDRARAELDLQQLQELARVGELLLRGVEAVGERQDLEVGRRRVRDDRDARRLPGVAARRQRRRRGIAYRAVPAPDIQLVTRRQRYAERIARAAAVQAGTAGVRGEIDRRRRCRLRDAQIAARLGDAMSGGREIVVVLLRRLDQLDQLRAAEIVPPRRVGPAGLRRGRRSVRMLPSGRHRLLGQRRRSHRRAAGEARDHDRQRRRGPASLPLDGGGSGWG